MSQTLTPVQKRAEIEKAAESSESVPGKAAQKKVETAEIAVIVLKWRDSGEWRCFLSSAEIIDPWMSHSTSMKRA